jgi:hypothetical protein
MRRSTQTLGEEKRVGIDRLGKIIAPVAAVFGVKKGQLGQGKKAVLIALCEETSMQLLQCLLRLVIELLIQA